MLNRILTLVCLAVVATAAAGCRTRGTSAPPARGAPAWTYESLDDIAEEGQFYGVGIAEKRHIPAVSLQRSTAMNRAALELASQLRTVVQGVFKDYSEAAFSTQMTEGELDTLVSNVQQSVVDEVLIGNRIREVWINPDNGDFYALVSMGMDDIAARMRREIAEAERGRLRVNAAEAHKELERIIDRHRQGTQ